jgi:hypothetical protein
MRWDQRPFGVERACTCLPGQRSPDCASGFHLVEGFYEAHYAINEALMLTRDMGVPYRAVVVATGEVLAEYFAWTKRARGYRFGSDVHVCVEPVTNVGPKGGTRKEFEVWVGAHRMATKPTLQSAKHAAENHLAFRIDCIGRGIVEFFGGTYVRAPVPQELAS